MESVTETKGTVKTHFYFHITVNILYFTYGLLVGKPTEKVKLVDQYDLSDKPGLAS